jgi:DNA-binding response OmpR family regulator
MDGLEATAAIRSSEQASGEHLPNIALTTFPMKGDRERFLAAVSDAWVPKPIQSIDLSFAIDRLRSTTQSCHARQRRHGKKKSIKKENKMSGTIIDVLSPYLNPMGRPLRAAEVHVNNSVRYHY